MKKVAYGAALGTVLAAFFIVQFAEAAVIFSQPFGSVTGTKVISTTPFVFKQSAPNYNATEAFQIGGGSVYIYVASDSGNRFFNVCVMNQTSGVGIACSSNYEATATSTFWTLPLDTLNEGGTMIPGNNYRVRISDVVGTTWTVRYLENSAGNLYFIVRDINGGDVPPNWGAITFPPPIDFGAIQFVATSSSLFVNSTTSLISIADQCDDAGNIFSRGICYAFTYLFVPTPTVLNNYAALPELVTTKFPFSWVSDVQNGINDLSTSPVAAPVYSFALADLGIGSTTPIGNLLPNFVGFSTSTVFTYMSPTVWASGQLLISGILWMGLAYDVYATVRRRHSSV